MGANEVDGGGGKALPVGDVGSDEEWGGGVLAGIKQRVFGTRTHAAGEQDRALLMRDAHDEREVVGTGEGALWVGAEYLQVGVVGEGELVSLFELGDGDVALSKFGDHLGKAFG